MVGFGSDFRDAVTGPNRFKRWRVRVPEILVDTGASFLISSARYPALKVQRGAIRFSRLSVVP